MDDHSQGGPYEKIYSLLPDYVCGLIWTVDILWISALSVSSVEVYRLADAAARVMSPFHIPEFAVGFLLVVIGVMLPYAAARALNPIMITLLNIDSYRWFKKTPNPDVSQDHLRLAVRRLDDVLGISPPATAWARLFMQYLSYHRAPTVTALAITHKEISDRTFLAFPVSYLLGLLVFSALGRGVVPALVGSAIAIATILAAIHRSRHALRDWNTSVLLAFLVATTGPVSNKPASSMSSDAGAPMG